MIMKYIYLVIFKLIAEKKEKERQEQDKNHEERQRRDTHSDKNAGNQRKKIAGDKYAFKKGYNETIQRQKQNNFVERIKTIMIRKVENYSSIFFYP